MVRSDSAATTGGQRSGQFALVGDAWGDLLLAPTSPVGPVFSADKAPTQARCEALLAAVDDARTSLADDERIVFLLGYEAGVALAFGDGLLRDDVDPRLGIPAGAWRARVIGSARTALATPVAPPSLRLTTTTMAREAHLARVAHCGDYLRDGVIYQANLAHRLDVDAVSDDDARAFFASRTAASSTTPVCAALLDLDGTGASLLSLSPERFITAQLREDDVGLAKTFPIKGTVPRGVDDDDDRRQLATLLASDKDQAEHVMIVDLLRNDLGRVAVVGGVTVTELLAPLQTPSVHHLESTIEARLLPGVGVLDLLRACAPGGSITGAPKSSAVEAIAALEDGPRGAYTGVLGLVDGAGALTTSLLIRTWLRADDGGPGALHVGGGIVVDSDPAAEWQETLDKARAFGEVRVR